MEFMDIFSFLSRWLHVVAGILWIGILYWFNFVNIPFAGTMDGETKKKVIPELLPRALYFFRWGAAYTWITGFLLLLLVYYHGGLMFDQGVEPWTTGSIVMVAAVFLMFFIYDALAKSSLGKNLKMFGVVAFALIGVIACLMMTYGKFGYRAYLIHTGTMFGSLMAANVWMRIWPIQKKVIAAIKEGTAPDAALVALAGQRSRHNVYMSVPLVWTMINMHTVTLATDNPLNNTLILMTVVLIGWGLVALMYKKSGQVKGF